MYFYEVADEWLIYKKNSVKESTYYNYMINIENHLKPYFEKIRMNDIIAYNEFIQNLSERLSTKTVRDIVTIFKAIIRYYEEEYDCSVKMRRVAVPKLERKKLKILTKREKEKLERYCTKNLSTRSLGILICLNTGLRIGEMCSLKWKNIDFNEKSITIQKTVQRIYNQKEKKTKIVIDKAKTAYSIRTIPMNKKLYEILRSVRKQYKPDDFILSGSTKCIEPRAYQNMYKALLRQSKIRAHKFHILRHTFASECIEVGMDIKSLSEILGHADINITLKIYVHSSDRMKKKYLEKI